VVVLKNKPLAHLCPHAEYLRFKRIYLYLKQKRSIIDITINCKLFTIVSFQNFINNTFNRILRFILRIPHLSFAV